MLLNNARLSSSPSRTLKGFSQYTPDFPLASLDWFFVCRLSETRCWKGTNRHSHIALLRYRISEPFAQSRWVWLRKQLWHHSPLHSSLHEIEKVSEFNVGTRLEFISSTLRSSDSNCKLDLIQKRSWLGARVSSAKSLNLNSYSFHNSYTRINKNLQFSVNRRWRRASALCCSWIRDKALCVCWANAPENHKFRNGHSK